MNNMEQIFKIKKAWDTFASNHPKFPMFLSSIKKRGISEGTIIAISITAPDGTVTETNLKVTSTDMELFESLKSMSPY